MDAHIENKLRRCWRWHRCEKQNFVLVMVLNPNSNLINCPTIAFPQRSVYIIASTISASSAWLADCFRLFVGRIAVNGTSAQKAFIFSATLYFVWIFDINRLCLVHKYVNNSPISWSEHILLITKHHKVPLVQLYLMKCVFVCPWIVVQHFIQPCSLWRLCPAEFYHYCPWIGNNRQLNNRYCTTLRHDTPLQSTP